MGSHSIAVVGVACRLPKANNLHEFWELLASGEDGISCVPEGRWTEEKGVCGTGQKNLATQAGFLSCPVDEFDAKFFGMSPKEMEFVDPQQRLLLEVTWEALEDATMDPHSLRGTQTGIFTGTYTSDYTNLMIRSGFLGDNDNAFVRAYLGNGFGATAGRLAYFYGTTGSTVANESGCSSAMLAVGLACHSLRRGDVTLALACGVNLLLQPFVGAPPIMAPDGHCKTFDAAGDGFGRAEGCGVVVLKRLEDALRDGDNIRGIIRGYGEAQEGPSRSLGTPTVDVEALAMTLALRDAEVEPWEVSYLEAHGTGTAVGDPLEMAAIGKVYTDARRKFPLVVGTVKTNVGHTESVAGITGIIKTLLAFEHDVIPPHRNLTNLHPKIDLEEIPAVIPLYAMPWKGTSSQRRFAGVSSFGLAGTDTHVILEEPPAVSTTSVKSPLPLNLVVLSARSQEALSQVVSSCVDYVRSNQETFSDFAYTWNISRTKFKEFRAAIVSSNAVDFVEKVEAGKLIQAKTVPSLQRPKVCFLFPGQATQFFGMGKELYDTHPVFTANLDKIDKILREDFSIDIRAALWSDSSLLERISHSQTSIFAMQFCLVEHWATLGITPDVVAGHSLGEFAAAVAAGILSLEDALRLIVGRAKLIELLPSSGKMLVVKADETYTLRLLRILSKEDPTFSLEVAARNSPQQTTVAGTEQSVLQFQSFCKKMDVKSVVLKFAPAVHSSVMDDILPEFRKLTQNVTFNPPTCIFLSSANANVMTCLDSEYFVAATRNPVNFIRTSFAMKEICEGSLITIDLGPQPVITTLLDSNLTQNDESLTSLISMNKNESPWRTLLESLASLHTLGIDVDWIKFYKHFGGRRLQGLPTYPFQRKKFWFPVPKRTPGTFLQSPEEQIHPFVHTLLPTATDTKIFQTRIVLEEFPFLKDHKIGEHVIFPAAGYLEMIIAVAEEAFQDSGESSLSLVSFSIHSPLGLSSSDFVDLQVVVDDHQSSGDFSKTSMQIFQSKHTSEGKQSWKKLVTVWFGLSDKACERFPLDLDTLKMSIISPVDLDVFYSSLRKVGLLFGPSFLSLQHLWRSDTEAFAEVKVPSYDSGLHRGKYFIHPVALDSIFQTIIAATSPKINKLAVPIQIQGFQWTASLEDSSTYFVHLTLLDSAEPKAALLDVSGRIVASIESLSLIDSSVEVVEAALDLFSHDDQSLSLLEEVWSPSTVPKNIISHPSPNTINTWLILLEKGTSNITSQMASSIKRQMSVKGKLFVDVTRPDEIPVELQKGTVEGILFLRLELTSDHYQPTKDFLHLLKELTSTQIANRPKLVLVTKGAVAVGAENDIHPHAATLWGMSRTFRSEYPEIKCLNIDVDLQDSLERDVETLVKVLLTTSEQFVAIRSGSFFTANLKPLYLKNNLLKIPSLAKRFSLKLPQTNSINDLRFEADLPRPLDTNSVEVEVRAYGLNFRDVFTVLKVTNDFEKDASLGSDFSGVVTAVGIDVKKWRVGDDVIGCSFKNEILPSHLKTDQDSLVSLPPSWTFEEGSTVPTVFLTAFHCLIDIAKLKIDEVVLIHAGAGGVGLAAIQVARNIGARIIATAGSKRKRTYLRQVVGIPDVFHSRDLTFTEKVKDVTGGVGVDVVLNSLTGSGFKEASLEILRQKGRFVEMSKLNIWTEDDVTSLRSDVDYTVVDIKALNPHTLNPLVTQLGVHIQAETLRPIPFDSFAAVDIRAALSHLQKAQAIGKVVCRMPQGEQQMLFDERSSHLITGGLGGVGLEVAKWMSSEGAKFIILCGRSSPSFAAQDVISKLSKAGVSVSVVQADVGDIEDCKRLFDVIENGFIDGRRFPSLRGIHHCAGSLSDALLHNQTWKSYENVFHGKVKGAWNLHLITTSRNFHLETFVLHSSISALLGIIGQSNYAGANAFLDSLAHHRHSKGLKATSINWGQWSQIGMGADLDIEGFIPIPPTNALASLKQILQLRKPHTSVCTFDFPRLRQRFPWLFNGYANHLLSIKSKKSNKTSQRIPSDPFFPPFSNLWESLISNPNDTDGLILDMVLTGIRRTLKLDTDDTIDVNASFEDVGLDSLMLVELKNEVQEAVGKENLLFTTATISEAFYIHQLAKDIGSLVKEILTKQTSNPLP